MRDLHEMSIGQRVMVTVIIVVVVMILLAVIGYLSGRWEVDTAQGEALRVSSKWDDQLDELERQALGQAFQKHIAQLYNIWVTDNYQPKIPPRALNGARNARDAYVRSMEAIENRAQAPLHK